MFVKFGTDTEGHRCLANGWTHGDNSYEWAIGRSSSIILPGIPFTNYGMSLTISAFTHNGPDDTQSLCIILNENDVGRIEFTRNIIATIEIPRRCVNQHGINHLEIRSSLTVVPASRSNSTDQRELAFGLRYLWFKPVLATMNDIDPPIPGLSDKEMLSRFESLGDDCEFGFVQKDHGVDTPSLLRFGGMRLHRLREALDNGFAGIEDRSNLTAFGLDGGEHMIMQNYYRYAYHTFVSSLDVSRAEILDRESKRLAFCKRKLVDDLQDGEKIFVVKTSGVSQPSLGDVVQAAEAMRRYGNGVLLWVIPEDANNPVGNLRWHSENMLEARIDKLAPVGSVQHYSPYWMSVCRRAYRAVQFRSGV